MTTPKKPRTVAPAEPPFTLTPPMLAEATPPKERARRRTTLETGGN